MDWKEALSKIEGLPQGDDAYAQEAPSPVHHKKDTLRVVVDKKGRKGKVATIVEGFTISDEEVARIAASLKKSLGVGGSNRDGEILIQGDLAERVRNLLRDQGFKVK